MPALLVLTSPSSQAGSAEHCAGNRTSCSASSLFGTRPEAGRYLHCCSRASCQELPIISHPKLGWVLAKQKHHLRGLRRQIPALVSRKEGAHFPLPFLPPEKPKAAPLRGMRGRKPSLLREARSRGRCKAAASRERWESLQQGPNPHSLVRSRSNPAAGMGPEPADGGVPSVRSTNLAHKGGQRNPTQGFPVARRIPTARCLHEQPP